MARLRGRTETEENPSALLPFQTLTSGIVPPSFRKGGCILPALGPTRTARPREYCHVAVRRGRIAVGVADGHQVKGMRIKQLDIASWRQFRDVSIPFPDNGVICLVGANGSGKSSILYLIRHIYAILGVPGKTMGVPEQRLGTWLESDSITATVTVEVPDGHKVENLEFSQSPLPVSTFDVSTLSSVLDSWNGDLIIDIVKSVDGQPIAATAANIAGEDVAKLIGSAIADQIASIEASVEALVEASVETTSEDQYFHLGVLRWSGEPFNPYSGIDQGPYRSRTRAPQKFTVHAAGGWGAMLGPYRERQAAWKVKAAELAMQGKLLTDPYPEPPLKAINRLSELLPHVSLSGYSRGDAPTFRTPGGEVTLDQLSAGEQSIVSTLVTAEALGPSLKTILIDEPEMHFNGELVRRLVTVLREEFPGTLIVLATHSFDVIESAGDINTWWLLRDAQTFEVNTALRWIDGGPLLQLAYELGVPALSFTGRTYIAAEGEHGSTFDRRFEAFGGNDFAYRFVPRTSSLEVERFAKMFNDAEPALGQLADLLPMQEIRVGGVIDRDFRSQESVDAIESSGRVHVWRKSVV